MEKKKGFQKHEASDSDMEAIARYVTAPATVIGDIGDLLARTLQDSSTSAAQGNRLTQDVVKTLLKDRTNTSFSLFWARTLQGKTTEIQTIEDPKLPRKGKVYRPGTNLESRTLSTFQKLPKIITNESTLMR